MSIICSCGHRIEDFEEAQNVICQSESLTEEGYRKALSYQTVCQSCKQEYKEAGVLFNTEEEAFKWLTKGDKQ
jgi:hypothetical protein